MAGMGRARSSRDNGGEGIRQTAMEWTTITLEDCDEQTIWSDPENPADMAVDVDATGAGDDGGGIDVDGGGSGYPNPTTVDTGSASTVSLLATFAVTFHYRKAPNGPSSIVVRYLLHHG